MSYHSSMPLAPGERTQDAIAQIEHDASKQAFPPVGNISRSTILRSKMKNNISKKTRYSSGNK